MVHFLIHNELDSVGVAIVDLKPGDIAHGIFMETQKPIQIKIVDPIPLCHKISLKEMKAGEMVIKYGHDIGKALADINPGQHVHIHNLKTKRW